MTTLAEFLPVLDIEFSCPTAFLGAIFALAKFLIIDVRRHSRTVAGSFRHLASALPGCTGISLEVYLSVIYEAGRIEQFACRSPLESKRQKHAAVHVKPH